jgi:hypothetical protein
LLSSCISRLVHTVAGVAAGLFEDGLYDGVVSFFRSRSRTSVRRRWVLLLKM